MMMQASGRDRANGKWAEGSKGSSLVEPLPNMHHTLGPVPNKTLLAMTKGREVLETHQAILRSQ